MVNAFKSESLMKGMVRGYDKVLERWQVRPEEVDVSTRFGTTHCLIAGSPSAPPLVLLHGVGDNSAVMWVFNVPDLSTTFRCFAVDTLGGPGKSVPNEEYGKRFSQVDWIQELCDRLGLERPSFLGVSNGAYMAFNFACERPDAVRKAVCIEGGPVTRPIASMIGTLGILFPEILAPTDENLVRILRKLASPDTDVFDRHPWIVEHLILAMRSHRRSAMFPHELRKYDPRKATRVKDKLLFILGGHRIREKQAFVGLLARDGFRYEIVDHAGHGVNHEQSGIVNALVRDFLLR